MIRIRETDDLDTVQELDRVCLPLDKPMGALLDASIWWLAEEDGHPVGYAGLKVEGEKAFLCRAGVVPEARGRGLQKRLIDVRVRAARRLGCKRVWTYVAAFNFPSANSLAAKGFKLYAWEKGEGTSPTSLYYERKVA